LRKSNFFGGGFVHACGLVVCVVVIVFVDVADVVIIVTDAVIIIAGLVIAVCPCIDCRLLNMKIVRATGLSHRWKNDGVVNILS
jgi:hypothetical protein